MTRTKIERRLKEFLADVGNVILVRLIDYFYQDETNQCLGWKVREEYTVEDILKMNLNSKDNISVSSITARDVVELLDKYKGKPLEEKITYADTYADYRKRREDKEEQKKKNYQKYLKELNAMDIPMHLFQLPPRLTTYSTKRGKRRR